MEVNNVTYDPAEITRKEMEKVLRNAGTYRETFSDK